MSNPIKILAGQTAIYGVSSIVGRLLNYLLVPVYTNYFLTHEFGVVVEMYSYVVFLIVILTYGMETAIFRFSQGGQGNKEIVFSTSLLSVFTTSLLFIIFTGFFNQELANLIRYPENPQYVLWFGIIIGLDAFNAIPFARLRAENRPVYFAVIKLTGIVVNIILVLFFIIFCPWVVKNDLGLITQAVNSFYNPAAGVDYVFISNLVASSVTTLLLLPVILRTRLIFSFPLWRTMLLYALPLMVAGLAGVVNEAIDRLLLKYLLPEEIAMSQLGIYGACYRVSVLMILFIQAFRFAAEPFFFAEYTKSDSKVIYARVMKIFVFTCLLIFLGIMLFMDIVQYFIGSDFRVGLDIVPILLMAHIFLGVYFNLSIWYKLTDKTHYGAYITMIGALITIVLNLFLIPRFGYHGAAWVHLASYAAMTVISFYWGKKYFPVPYATGRIIFFTILALLIYLLHSMTPDFNTLINLIISFMMLISFMWMVLFIDRDIREAVLDLMKFRKPNK